MVSTCVKQFIKQRQRIWVVKMKPHYRYNWKTKEWEVLLKFKIDIDYKLDFNDFVLHPDSGLSVNAHRAIFGEDNESI